MIKIFSTTVFCTFVFLLFGLPVLTSAQNNNLKIAFKDAASSPRNIVVCGNEATVTVTVGLDGISPLTRKNIQATLNFFKGVQFVSFNAAQSSPGVSVASNIGSHPVFSIPVLDPAGLKSVDISYTIRADCDYTDTLSKNDLLDVYDRWDFLYALGTQNGLKETDFSTQYRDQLRVPYLTIFVSNNAGNNARSGNCYQRKIVVNNSGLTGFLTKFNYTNAQGKGVRVNEIAVNGKPITFTKTPAANGDTIIAANVTSDYFKYNTIGTGTPSNGDTIFDPNETVTIVENICLLNCNDSRSSLHAASWGCDGVLCNTVNRSDIVRTGQGAVNVVFQSGVGTNTVGGYCKKGISSVVFTNNGIEIDAGVATMHNILTGIGVGGKFNLNYNGYKITAITIAGVRIAAPDSALVTLSKYPQFHTDPDGVGGLTDADGDGIYDDLPIGQSVNISVEYDVACNFQTINVNDVNCFNNFESGFSAQIQYADNCNAHNTVLQAGYFTPFNGNALIENCPDPDARTDGKYFSILHTERRSVFNFDKSCNSQEQFQVKIKLPIGISAVKDSMFLTRFTDTLPLSGFRQSADTVYLTFDAHKLNFLNGDYSAKMGFTAGCTAVPGASVFPMEMAFYCPPCDCRHVWYCDSVKGPDIHYSVPPCPDVVAYQCPKGLLTSSFEVNRTTFGFADSTYTKRLIAAQANTKVAIACDSVQMIVRNVVGNTLINDSIGIRISYDNIVKGDSNRLKEIFIFGKGTVQITHGGKIYNCNVNASEIRTAHTDTTKTLYFDLNNCFQETGLTQLVKGDSVNFFGNFSVNPEGPYKYSFEKIPNFRAYGYSIDNGQEFACGNNYNNSYGQIYRVGRSELIFNFPNSFSFPKGCTETNLDYTLLIRSVDYTKYFGNEWRQAIKLDSFIFNLDTALYKAFDTKVQVSIPVHPIYGDTFFDLPALSANSKYIVRFDTLKSYFPLSNTGNTVFTLRVKVMPSCRSLTASSNGNNRFLFAPNMFYRDRYYAAFIGDGSCSKTRHDTTALSNDRYLTYSNPADLVLTAITNPTVISATDTVEWTMKVCNQSQEGNANGTWFSVEPTIRTPNFKVISMTDITNNTNNITLAVQRFDSLSNKYFAFTNGVTPAVGNNTFDNVCNVIKIKAVSTDCQTIPIDFKTGWYCIAPTDKNWSPDKYAPCVVKTLRGEVRILFPNLEAGYLNQSLIKPGICDTTTLEILMKNTDLGTAYDLRTRLTIPLQGASFVPNSIEVAYPPSAPYQKIVVQPAFIGQNQFGKIYEFADFTNISTYLKAHGLIGFNPEHPNDSNQFKIRFRFTNDCAFRSGALAYFSFIGSNSCGTPTNYTAGESLPLQIEGAQLDTQKLYKVSFDITDKFTPGGASFINVRIKNLTTVPSDGREKITVRLPSNISYVNASASGIFPVGWQPVLLTQEKITNMTSITWQMVSGLTLNQEAVLHFAVLTPDSVDCNGGTRTTSLVTTIQKQLLCTKSQTLCQSDVITASGGEYFFNLNIGTDSIGILANNTKVAVNNIFNTTIGNAVHLSATLATHLEWRDADSHALLSTDTAFDFTPTRALTNITVNALGTKCLAGVILKIVAQHNNNYVISIRDTTIECDAPNPTNTPIVISPAGAKFQFSVRDTIIRQICGFLIIRTFTVVGTAVTAVQIITVKDTKAPSIKPRNPILIGLRSGDTLTVDCKKFPLLKVDDMVFTDNCDSAPKKQFYDVALQRGNCLRDNFLELLHCAWKATDACGNMSVFDIFIKVIDNDTPVLVNVPRDTTLPLNASLPIAPINIFARDNCDDNPLITFNETHSNNIITRKWTATDACGHSSSISQNITAHSIPSPTHFTDTIPPVLTFDALGGTNYLFGSVNDITCDIKIFLKKENVKISDNYDKFPVLVLDSTVTAKSNTCNVSGYLWSKKYTWTGRDSSGNTNSKSIEFRFIDTVPPIFSSYLISNVNHLLSASDTSIPEIILSTTDTLPDVKISASDACTSVKIKENIQFVGIVNLDSLFKRTWTATDGCNNTSYLSQNITRLSKRDTVINTLKDVKCKLFTQNGFVLNATNCTSLTGFCIPILSAKLSSFSIFDNGTLYNGIFSVCDTNATFIKLLLSAGIHKFIIKNNDSAHFCTDTVFVQVNCPILSLPRVDTVEYSTLVNQTATVCLSELIGARYSTLNKHISALCSDTTNIGIGLEILNDSCVSVTGKKEGQFLTCFTLCDNTGKPCDTLRIQFLVSGARISALYAADDSATTHINTPVNIYILRNDSTLIKPADLVLISQPNFGQARIESNTEQYIQYLPNTDFCSSVKSDIFYYRICANGKCVQAAVTVRVLCDKLIIYNGFSPNGDGKNDVFFIEGLQDHPNTKVYIYNRWGTQIYLSNDYRNDWGGKWHGDNAPDGTYFYQIILENGEHYTGYLQIQR